MYYFKQGDRFLFRHLGYIDPEAMITQARTSLVRVASRGSKRIASDSPGGDITARNCDFSIMEFPCRNGIGLEIILTKCDHAKKEI